MNPYAPTTQARLRTAVTAAVNAADAHAFARYISAEMPPVEAVLNRLAEPVPLVARPLTRSFVLIVDGVCRRSPHPLK